MFKVSQSKLKTWRQCRRAWYYKYVMNITRKHKPYAFMRGTIVHDTLEAFYKGENWRKVFNKTLEQYEKPIRLNPEEYGSLPQDLKILLSGYVRHYKDDDITPIEVEEEFEVKLATGIVLTGKIDLIAKAKNLKWMVEHKCKNLISKNTDEPFANVQSALYMWAKGMKLDGVIWNYLLGKPQKKPSLLKNGEMSRKVTSLTWPVYRDALKEAGLKPSDYSDMKEALKGNEEHYYQRTYVPLDEALVMNIVDEAKITAKDMQKYGGKDKTRNLTWTCDKCEFKKLCYAQLKGLDDNYILKADFKERK